jgi:hypothetical protein
MQFRNDTVIGTEANNIPKEACYRAEIASIGAAPSRFNWKTDASARDRDHIRKAAMGYVQL